MKVKDLIAVLEGFEPDAAVIASVRDGEQVRGVRKLEDGKILLCGTNLPEGH